MFWDNCIRPNIIPPDVITRWCDVLFRYVEDDNAVFAIRAFNNRNQNGDEDLRRGFYTQTNKNYSFFYTDNYFSAFFCKMALDHYIPEYNEFKKMFITRTFPARFGQSCQTERNKAAFKINAQDPQINRAGYKISHIIDVGGNYSNEEKSLTISHICKNYFPRGNYSDWKKKHDYTGTYFSRILEVPDHAVKYLKAIFLRTTCPLNYILTPKKNYKKLSEQLIKMILEKINDYLNTLCINFRIYTENYTLIF